MLTSNEIKNVTFGRAGRGYKTSDVDALLDRAIETIDQLNAENAELLRKMEILAEKIQEYRNDEDSIRAALLTAQRSADQIMKEAKEKSEALEGETRAKTEEALSAAKNKAEEMLLEAQQKSVAIVNETREKATVVMAEAKQKSENMLREAEEGCRAELMQLEATKKQAAEFRAALMDMYRQQFELMKKGPAIEYVPKREEEPEVKEEVVLPEREEETPVEDKTANYVSPEDIPLPIAEKPTDYQYDILEDDFDDDNDFKIENGFSVKVEDEDF